MPKRIVTKASIRKIMRVLDRWEGKLTWPLFCAKVASVVKVESVSRHTLMRYDGIRHRFKERQKELRDLAEREPRDYALESATKRISNLEAQVGRQDDIIGLLMATFVRWQYNAYAHGMRIEQLDAPLPAVDRSGHG